MSADSNWDARIKKANDARAARDAERAIALSALELAMTAISSTLQRALPEIKVSEPGPWTDPSTTKLAGYEISVGTVMVRCTAVHDGKRARVEADAWGPFSKEGRPTPRLLDPTLERLVKAIPKFVAEAYEREMEADIERDE